MSNQLSLFGIQHDQNTFQSMLWGTLTFCQSESAKWNDTCRHCLLWKHKEEQTDTDECLSAPCSGDERNDKRNGYFSIRQMPKN